MVDYFADLFYQICRGCRKDRSCRKVAGFCGFGNDRKHFREDDRGLLEREMDELRPRAIETTADFVGQQKLSFIEELLDAPRHGFSADVVGASRIAKDGSKSTRASNLEWGRSAEHSRACAGDHYDARDFPRGGERKNQVTGNDNGGCGKDGFEIPLNFHANRGLACARNASQNVSDIEGRLRSGAERLLARLREGRGGSFRSHVDGVGCAGAG